MRTFSALLLASFLWPFAVHAQDLARPVVALRSGVPKYPSAALRHEIQGLVRLRVHVLADGRVGDVLVQQSSGNAHLDAAAVEAARTSEFRAAQTREGTGVDSWVVVPYQFVLQ